jgi:hypothetical protein
MVVPSIKTLAPGIDEVPFSETDPVKVYFCCANTKKGARNKSIRRRIDNLLLNLKK